MDPQRRPRSQPHLTPLHTSPSYIHPNPTIPSPPSLLSRPTSTTRLRLRPQPSKSTSALPKTATTNRRRSGHRYKAEGGNEEDWITRTASTLTLTRLEEKGESWLVKRESSVSLVGGDDEGDEVGGWEGEGDVRDSRRRRQEGIEGADEGGPDFVDLHEEFEDGEEVDEGEMRKVVMGRVGGWVDWAVGWLDMRGEDGDGDADGEDDGGSGDEERVKGDLDPVELQKRLRRKKGSDQEGEGGEGEVGKPLEGEQAGAWSDAKWLLGVARKVAL